MVGWRREDGTKGMEDEINKVGWAGWRDVRVMIVCG